MTPAHIKVLGALALLIVLAWVIGGRAQRVDAVQGQQINRISGHLLAVLSLIALFAVMGGYFFPGPRGDEGAAAHIFQLAVVAIVLVGTLFLSSARWSEGWLRIARPLALPGIVLALAFGALYHLEHYYR